jgi:hypothetical protein
MPERFQFGSGIADPEGQRRPVGHDALARQDLGLAIERTMIGVFRDQHMGDHPLGRQTALDQPGGRCRLHHRT